MHEHHRFTIQSHNAPTVLPRLALLFSRRRVPIAHLEMTQNDGGEHATFGLVARCAAVEAGKIEAQILRIVEVLEVTVAAGVAPAPSVEALSA